RAAIVVAPRPLSLRGGVWGGGPSLARYSETPPHPARRRRCAPAARRPLPASGERWSSRRLPSLSTARRSRLSEFARLARSQFFAATTSFTAPTQPVWVRSNTIPSGSLYLASE